MKIRFVVFSILASSLVLVACATSGKSPIANAPESNINRRVAQQSTVEYSTDKRDLPKVCGHAPEAKISVSPNQLVLSSRQEAVTRYLVRTPSYNCETTESDGRGGDWKGFYDRAGDKSDMLAAAIKGVGKKTAPYLVPYFQQGKPRSWRAFSDLIVGASKEIEARYGVSAAWTSGVLKRYKQDNMQNLGYLSGADCNVSGYTDETIEERVFIQDIPVVVETRIRGAKLLPGECDTYTVSWDGREVTGAVNSDSNTYSVSVNYDGLTADISNGRKAVVTYKGERSVVKPGYLIEIQGSSAVASGGSVQINVRNAALNAMTAVPEFANACKMSATVVISGRKGSAWTSKKTAALKSATFQLNGTAEMTSYTANGITLSEKQHPVVKISTSFAPGCPFFTTEAVNNGIIEE